MLPDCESSSVGLPLMSCVVWDVCAVLCCLCNNRLSEKIKPFRRQTRQLTEGLPLPAVDVPSHVQGWRSHDVTAVAFDVDAVAGGAAENAPRMPEVEVPAVASFDAGADTFEAAVDSLESRLLIGVGAGFFFVLIVKIPACWLPPYR